MLRYGAGKCVRTKILTTIDVGFLDWSVKSLSVFRTHFASFLYRGKDCVADLPVKIHVLALSKLRHYNTFLQSCWQDCLI